MYAWLWRHLPGSTAIRALIVAALVVVVVAACFLWVFPAIAPFMPFNDQTVGE